MVKNLYRNDSLIQKETYVTDPQRVDELIAVMREKWAILREGGLAGDYPVELLRSAPSNGNGNAKVEVVEIFRWQSHEDRVNAEANEQYQQLTQRIDALTGSEGSKETYTGVVRGFNSKFPVNGAMELLKGICSCLLTIDGMVEKYPMSVKNGIVLMHRSPRADLDGDGHNEMYLHISFHGGEQTIPGELGELRVEQNFELPNDGIVRSNNPISADGDDFPATAIWRVYWKIQTALGAVLTDPDQPLIFGPATVNHYPPVGTHFHSATGPIKLIHEKSGRVVGELIPGELTAFDIVVTKDDEIFAGFLNRPRPDIFQILAEHAPRMEEYEAKKVLLPAD